MYPDKNDIHDRDQDLIAKEKKEAKAWEYVEYANDLPELEPASPEPAPSPILLTEEEKRELDELEENGMLFAAKLHKKWNEMIKKGEI